jgi:hypothetical protein
MHLTICKCVGCSGGGPRAPSIRHRIRGSGRALDLGLLPEVVLSLGSVPLAEYAFLAPGAIERHVAHIPEYDALLLANHGAVATEKTCGRRSSVWIPSNTLPILR